MKSHIKIDIKNGIGQIVFYHEKGNSFPSSQLTKLQIAINELGENDDVKIIMLKSEGEKVFSAGASFDELLTIKNKEEGKKFFSGFAKIILSMINCPKFIIGCIQGKSVGGGVGLIAGCDYVLAHNNASIRLSELSIGIGPFVIEPAISRKIGINSFAELTLTPHKWASAKWCHTKGLYNEVFDDFEKLERTSISLAKQLSLYNPESMRLLKSIFWKETTNWEEIMYERASMSGNLVLSDFARETLMNFKTK